MQTTPRDATNDLNSGIPAERGTGLILAAFSLLAGLVLFGDVPACLAVSIVVAGVLAGLSAWAPHRLRPLQRLFIRSLFTLTVVLRPLVMALVFMFAIVPLGVFMQHGRGRARRRPMHRKAASQTTATPS